MRFLLLAFVAIPIIEMWLLIEVGSRIGALPTIGLVLLTAVIGVTLLRQQGLATLIRGHRRLEEGELPASEICEGLVLAVSGALLLTPGFVTDAIGFAGLLPLTRKWLVRQMLARLVGGGFSAYEVHQRRTGQSQSTFDGEYWHDQDRSEPESEPADDADTSRLHGPQHRDDR